MAPRAQSGCPCNNACSKKSPDLVSNGIADEEYLDDSLMDSVDESVAETMEDSEYDPASL